MGTRSNYSCLWKTNLGAANQKKPATVTIPNLSPAITKRRTGRLQSKSSTTMERLGRSMLTTSPISTIFTWVLTTVSASSNGTELSPGKRWNTALGKPSCPVSANMDTLDLQWQPIPKDAPLTAGKLI